VAAAEVVMSESPFLRARELLLRHRDDPVAASREFAWPVLHRFNWALDYFDVFARANHRTALHVVSDDGTSRTHTFAEMSERSNRAANLLRRRGASVAETESSSCSATSPSSGRSRSPR
jgi:acetyl-CoA synthetase